MIQEMDLECQSQSQHVELFICNTLLKLTKMEEYETKIKTYADTDYESDRGLNFNFIS